MAPRCEARTHDCTYGVVAVAKVFRRLGLAQPCRCIKPATHKITSHICAHRARWPGAGTGSETPR